MNHHKYTNPERDYSTLPDQLKKRAQWVVWKKERRPDGTVGKVPYNPVTGEKASVTDSLTWGRFEQAVEAYEAGGYDGVGFVLTGADPLMFMDFDDARDPEEAKRLHDLGLPGWLEGFKPWAADSIREIDSYAYIALSQSGTGAHAILEGKLPGKGGKRTVERNGEIVGRFEMYDRDRFVALTGRTLHTGVMVKVQHKINEIWNQYGFRSAGDSDHGAGWGSGPYDGEIWQTGLSVDEALAKARNAKNGDVFAALFDRADLSGHENDHSRGDMALVGILAFYLGPDPDRIDEAFRRSKLYRDKWDRDDYRDRTIGAVLNDKGSDQANYWSRERKSTSQGESDSTSASGESTEKAKPRFQFLTIEDYRKRPKPKYLIDGLILEGSQSVWYGDKGSYKSFLSLDAELSVATGINWQGFKTKQGPTAHIIGEGGGLFAKRPDAWMQHHRIENIPNFYMLPAAPKLNKESDLNELIDAIKALPEMPVLVVVDTLSRTFMGNENGQEDMQRYRDAAAAIQELGAAVIVIHHSGRNGQLRGSSVLPDDADSIVRFDKKGNGVQLTVEKTKDDESPKPIRLTKEVVTLSDPPSGPDEIDTKPVTSLVFTRDDSTDSASASLTDAQVHILKTLFEAGDDGLTYAEWRKVSGKAKSTFDDARRILDGLGFIGTTTPLLTLRTPHYRVTGDGREFLDSLTGKGANDAA